MTNTPAIVTRVFQEYDAYIEAVEDAELQCMPKRVVHPLWRKTSICLPGGTHIQVVADGSADIAQGCTPRDGYAVLLLREYLFVANGVPVQPGSVFFMPPGSEFLLSFLAPQEWLSVFIPTPVMRSVLPDIDLADRDRDARHARIIEHGTYKTSRLWALIERYIHYASTAPHWIAGAEALASFERDLLLELKRLYLPVCPVAAPSRGRPMIINRNAITAAINHIENCPEAIVTIPELVQMTGLSERSLRAGFKRFTGVSPSQYIQMCLLNRVRRRLTESASEEVTVTRVAGESGFWDLGRFAKRYQEAFGELPSETLRERERS